MDTELGHGAAHRTPVHAFSRLLRGYRLAAGLTQEALAERAGIGVRSISDLERDGPHTPRRDTIQRLAEALALAPADRERFAEAAGRLSALAPATSLPQAGAPPFVGRTSEMALLERHLAGDGPPLLVLAGEPGIGKTRLLHLAASRALGQGLAVLEGGCQRRGGQEPYAPLLAALKGYLRRQTPARQRTALRGCAWLVRLLPELAEGPIEPLPAWALPPVQERRLMFEAVTRLLTNIAGPSGTALLLDDLQWAGPDALDLLAALARRAAEVPLRVLGAYRDTEVQTRGPLGELLADLAHAGLAVHRRLQPLAPAEAVALLDGLLPDAEPVLRARVLERAGGVPFFVVSCVQELAAVQEEDGTVESTPWDVAQSVRQRVAALPERAQEVLGVAAVLGREVDPTVIMNVVEHGEFDVLDALDATRQARLLVEEQDRYRFAHDVIREVVEADLGMTRRGVLHRRIAEALEQRRGVSSVEVLAYHFGRGAVHEKAVLYLELAGDQAQLRRAHGAAESYYGAAVEAWEQLGQPLEAARLRVKAGTTLREMGRYETAQAVLGRAADGYRLGGNRAQLIGIVAEIGRHYEYRGRSAEGLCWLEPQVAALEAATIEDGMGHVLAPVCEALAILHKSLGHCAEAVAMTARSVELSREAGAGIELATALYRHGFTLIDMVGRIEDMRSVALEAVGMAEVAGDLNALHWSLYQLAYAQFVKGEWAAYTAYADRALAVAEQRGDPGPLRELARNRGIAAFYKGDWALARREAERARAFSDCLEDPYGVAYALLPQARLALAEGQWEPAACASAEVLALGQGSGRISDQREALEVLAELDLRAGRAREAYARLVSVRDGPGVEERGVTPLRVLLAWAHLELDEHEAAQETIAGALRRLRMDDDRLGLVDALRVQALILIRQEQLPDAEQAVQEGLQLARAMPYPYAEARLLQVYGQMLARQGSANPARKHLDVALAIFRRMGACKDIEQTEQILATLD